MTGVHVIFFINGLVDFNLVTCHFQYFSKSTFIIVYFFHQGVRKSSRRKENEQNEDQDVQSVPKVETKTKRGRKRKANVMLSDYITEEVCTTFIQVLENLESHGILFFSFPGLESHEILCRVKKIMSRSLLCIMSMIDKNFTERILLNYK